MTNSPPLLANNPSLLYIRWLMQDLGVNLAGVEAILHMRDRTKQMQAEMESEPGRMRQEYESENRRLKRIFERLQR